MNTERITAEREYKKAKAEWNTAANRSDITEEEFIKIDEKLKTARTHLVEMEIKHETAAETRKRAAEIKFRNRNPNF